MYKVSGAELWVEIMVKADTCLIFGLLIPIVCHAQRHMYLHWTVVVHWYRQKLSSIGVLRGPAASPPPCSSPSGNVKHSRAANLRCKARPLATDNPIETPRLVSEMGTWWVVVVIERAATARRAQQWHTSLPCNICQNPERNEALFGPGPAMMWTRVVPGLTNTGIGKDAWYLRPES